ncbi:transposase family protein [Herpetosiphon sp.]|nr:transposase family protein [Herpetosiphon sp.]
MTCATTTSRRYGRYCRRVLDLPWMTMPVQLELHLQRFRCPNRRYLRQTFVEPLPTLALPHAHRTTRLARTQQRFALALGGEAGVWTLNHLGITTSSDTLLRLIRAFEPAVAEAVTHGGIDDWAYHKRYGD